MNVCGMNVIGDASQEFYAGKEYFPDHYTAQDYGPMENIYEIFIMLIATIS